MGSPLQDARHPSDPSPKNREGSGKSQVDTRRRSANFLASTRSRGNDYRLPKRSRARDTKNVQIPIPISNFLLKQQHIMRTNFRAHFVFQKEIVVPKILSPLKTADIFFGFLPSKTTTSHPEREGRAESFPIIPPVTSRADATSRALDDKKSSR